MGERHPDLPLDMGGGGEGGGAGGAGGGTWTVVGLGGGTPEEPDREELAGDSGPYVIDRFNDRIVSPPSIVAGDAAGTVVVAGQARSSRTFSIGPWLFNPDQDDHAYTETPFYWVDNRHDSVRSGWAGHQKWTERPTWASCSASLSYCYIGSYESEQWFGLTVGAHPADMAGLVFTTSRSAYRGYGVAGAVEVVVLSSQPTAMRQGSIVAVLPPVAGSQTFTVPGSMVPAEGGTLWIGFRPGWTSNFKTAVYNYFCGWPSLNGPESYQTDSQGSPYGGWDGTSWWAKPTSATWQVYSAGDEDLGSTTLPDGAPFGGPHTWTPTAQTGSPTFGIDADGLYVESTAAASKSFALIGPGEDEDEDDGPWSSYEGHREDVVWSMDAVGETGQAGTRELEISSDAEGQSVRVTVHLGDGFHAAGISADGGAGAAYEAKTLAADTRYILSMDLRSGMLRGKVWADEGPLSEPAAWDVEVPIGSTLSEADRFTLTFRVGNITGSQRVTVRRLTAYGAASSGDTIVGEMVGAADGASRVFTSAHQYARGSLAAWVSGFAVKPLTEWPDLARYALDYPPTADAVIRCRYVVAAAEATDEDT